MKKIKNVFVLLFTFFISTPVFAETGCKVFAEYTSAATKIIMIAAPILLLILTTVDLMGAVSAGDEKDMKKSINTLVKRFVICLIILILPTIINIIVGWTVFDNFTACIGG